MTYGTEQWESTGAISVHTVLTAFTAQPLDKPSIFIWDEPEIGLAEEAQLGLGQFVHEQMVKGRENLLGCFFMTHSREFVHSFLDYPRMAFIDLDGQYETAEEWTQRELHPVTPQELRETGHARFKLVSALLNKGKK
jgi:hypothetical protein